RRNSGTLQMIVRTFAYVYIHLSWKTVNSSSVRFFFELCFGTLLAGTTRTWVDLELGVARRPGERDDIANVRHAGNEHKHALETEAEAGMWDSAVAPKIQIPFVIGWIEMMSTYVFLQHFE